MDAETVAVLVAAVTAEVGRVLYVDLTTMIRCDPDGAMTWVASWSGTGTPSAGRAAVVRPSRLATAAAGELLFGAQHPIASSVDALRGPERSSGLNVVR